MQKSRPRRPMAGGTGAGVRPERYSYWRVGNGTREWFPLDFWLERAGEFHGRPDFSTGDFHWNHSAQVFCHLSGQAVLDAPRRRAALAPGDIFIAPPGQPFTYHGQGVRFHWLAVAGNWPRILGDPHQVRHLSLGRDAEIEARLVEIREVLILQKHGYPLRAVGVFFELVARIEQLLARSPGTQSTYPEVVRNAMAYLTENYARPFVAAETAQAVNVSQSYLRALFEKWLGESPRQFHTRNRMAQASRLLREQQLSVAEVAAEVGYADARHFSRVFKAVVGASPSRYVKGLA